MASTNITSFDLHRRLEGTITIFIFQMQKLSFGGHLPGLGPYTSLGDPTFKLRALVAPGLPF